MLQLQFLSIFNIFLLNIFLVDLKQSITFELQNFKKH